MDTNSAAPGCRHTLEYDQLGQIVCILDDTGSSIATSAEEARQVLDSWARKRAKSSDLQS